MPRDTTIQAVVLASTDGPHRIIGVTRGTIDTLSDGADPRRLSMLGRFECVTDPLAVRDPLS